jgi:hypothetical protein
VIVCEWCRYPSGEHADDCGRYVEGADPILDAALDAALAPQRPRLTGLINEPGITVYDPENAVQSGRLPCLSCGEPAVFSGASSTEVQHWCTACETISIRDKGPVA